VEATVAPAAPAGPVATGRARISPAARQAAARLGVDLKGVAGTGPSGAVTIADVEHAAARPAPAAAAPGAPAAVPGGGRAAGMRGAIGAAMARSKREIPHLYLSTTIDVTAALEWLAEENGRRPVTERLLPAVLFLEAVGRACVEVPALNGFWNGQAFAPGPGVHVGYAIALRGGGLVAPALHDAASRPLAEIARDFSDLVARARAGALRSSEMSDPTITVTNLGDLGVEEAFAIIYPPQVAIVAIGRIVERPWVVEGRIEPRRVVTISVSADHRAVDGRDAGLFLGAIERALASPREL
jgi:pyruvate dehydrogenase E2 component (dihydrolipoamide acetyltransferase)